MPSTVVVKQDGFASADSAASMALRTYQGSVLPAFLGALADMGTVVIVSLALPGWVETSCKKNLPDVWPLVSAIPTYYARTDTTATDFAALVGAKFAIFRDLVELFRPASVVTSL